MCTSTGARWESRHGPTSSEVRRLLRRPDAVYPVTISRSYVNHRYSHAIIAGTLPTRSGKTITKAGEGTRIKLRFDRRPLFAVVMTEDDLPSLAGKAERLELVPIDSLKQVH